MSDAALWDRLPPRRAMPPTSALAALLERLAPRDVEAAAEVVAAPAVDVEALRAAAVAEGEARGFDAGHAAGYAEARAALAPLRADLAEAAAALDAARAIDADALAPLLADLVAAIATAVLGGARRDPAQLLPLATAALAEVRRGETAVLRAHPDTLAGLAPHLPGLATAADPALAPGSFTVAGVDFTIPVDLDHRLATVLAGLS